MNTGQELANTMMEAWAEYDEQVQKPCAIKRLETQAKEIECAFAGGVYYALNILTKTVVNEGPEAMADKIIALRKEVLDNYGTLKVKK